MIDHSELQNSICDRPSLDDQKDTQTQSTQSVDKKDSIIDPKDDRIIQLEILLAQLKERERNTVLRLQAEIENIRRRNIQEVEKIHKFSLERLISELLPVIDNLERTLSVSDHSNTLLSPIIEGIKLTLKVFLDTIYKFGIESIHDTHVPFDPSVHQAISVIESNNCKANQVLAIIQKGYLLNGRLIRPAMVTVSKFKNE